MVDIQFHRLSPDCIVILILTLNLITIQVLICIGIFPVLLKSNSMIYFIADFGTLVSFLKKHLNLTKQMQILAKIQFCSVVTCIF